MDNVTCTTDRDMDTMVCKINCRPGYMLDRDVQLICGLITDYTWSHVTKHNPLGWLPECVDASSVTLRTFKMEVRMKTRNITLVKAAIQRNTHKLIFEKCRYCTKEVSIMNEEPLVVSIAVSATSPNILSSTATDEETRTVIQRMKEFDDVSSLLYLKSSEIFITNIDNKIVEVVLSTLDTSVSHICPVGTKFYHEVCVSCGRGTYWENGECKLCPIGYYQPSLRRSCCYLCPVGKSTAGLGARSKLYCIAEPQSLYPWELGYWNDDDDKNVTAVTIVGVCPDAEPDAEEGNLKIITIVAFLLVLAIICAAVLCALRLRSKPQPPKPEKVPEAVTAAIESWVPSTSGESTI
ncbi:uncharacterized protein LOC131956126 [Physella acuta]|uniref:uncharacterized protein LOC131956126 n=1 Tax=Physella acuta TaxID=109671 RepID=UPI0027DB3AC1|nr:uncharacterized protein LOC131956126 [Physella acuta]